MIIPLDLIICAYDCPSEGTRMDCGRGSFLRVVRKKMEKQKKKTNLVRGHPVSFYLSEETLIL